MPQPQSPFLPQTTFRAWIFGTALMVGLPAAQIYATDFTWGGTTGLFSDSTKWVGGIAPSGLDGTDVLIFGGDVVSSPVYTATSDIATNPFLINQLKFTATDPAPGTGGSETIDGTTTIVLGGTSPQILQGGTASITIKVPLKLATTLTFAGDTVSPDTNHDKAVVTIDGAIAGNFDIVKNGTSTFRFGSTASTSASANTWFGSLTINAGTIRFNNNAYTAPTAIRANSVTLNSAAALLTTLFKSTDPSSSLRIGTLNGAAGTVEGHQQSATVVGGLDSIDMVITALNPGTYGGTINNSSASGGTGTGGKFVVRGVATQTLTGSGISTISKDVIVGRGAGLTLAVNASLSGQTANGSVILNGGTFTLDNSGTNNTNRLKDLDGSTTGLETIGGGKFSLIANSAGTSETVGRLQLGSGNPRSGALTINVTNAGSAATLTFQSYSRANLTSVAVYPTPLSTVNFTANDGNASLGTSTIGSRIFFSGTFTVPLYNNLLGNTGTASGATVGWATVNGTDFATYNASMGVRAVTLDSLPAGTTTGTATSNIGITGNFSLTNSGGYSASSIKITPSASGQKLDLASTGNLKTAGIILAGSTDYTIDSSGGGAIANAGTTTDPRYFHVQTATLTVNAGLNGINAPIVKAGGGLLELTSPANVNVTQPFALNEGTVRATPGSSLPAGELRFRGGVLEISGGATFVRQIGVTSGTVNWSGFDPNSVPANQSINQEQGSGGFAAFGADATVDLTTLGGTSDFSWEDTGFVNSGHAIIFGSARANAKVTWVDNLSLTAVGQNPNYNAREIRVVDNASSSADLAVLTGKISGSLHDDLLKTGAGTLVLASTSNNYLGATIVHEGNLFVNGTNQASYLTNVRNGAKLGGNGSVGNIKVETGGSITPGDTFGHTSKLTTKDIFLSGAGANLEIELGGTTIGGNGINGYDQLAVTGGVTLNGGSLAGSLINGFLASPTDLFFIVDNDGTDAVQGTFNQGSLVQIGSQFFDISYTGDLASNSFTGGNDIVLRLSAIPEPTSAMLLGTAALGLTMRRKRKSPRPA